MKFFLPKQTNARSVFDGSDKNAQRERAVEQYKSVMRGGKGKTDETETVGLTWLRRFSRFFAA